MADASSTEPPLPPQPIDRLIKPLERFLHVEAASGVVLLVAAAAALVLANSAWADSFAAIWKTKIGFRIGSFEMIHSVKHWINDGLMSVFFFVIGLEVKRELVLGELRDLRNARLPIVGAIGGMVVPAALYLVLQMGEPGESGWGVPMATDIAFVVGCLAVLGSRVPAGLRVMLLSLAIVDDIGAIVVIAVGYSDGVNGLALALGAAGIVLVLTLARLGVRSTGVYLIVGTAIWMAFHESGVHATVAGVVLGLLTPARSHAIEGAVGSMMRKVSDVLHGEGIESLADKATQVRQLRQAAREVISPVEYLENVLHPWVSFGIMPLFALANAGVVLSADGFVEPVAVAVIVGLALGKPLGILLASWIAVRLGFAALPAGVTWRVVTGAGALAGIGFTMALFIAELAVDAALVDVVKVGVLAASALSAVVGMAVLVTSLRRPDEPQA